MFQIADKGRWRIFLQDGDPSQNAACVKRALNKMRAKMFGIPPRSPDLSPIENLFNLVRDELNEQALKYNITRETFRQFQKPCNQYFQYLLHKYDR